MGAHKGFAGSAFSVRLNLVGRYFAQKAPQDRENPPFQGVWPILGLKTAKPFQCAPLEGGTKGQKRKKIAKISLFSTKTHFFETTTKKKLFNMFFDFFFGSDFFSGLKKSFQCARPQYETPRAKSENNSSVFVKKISETALKKKIYIFFQFFWVNFFCWLGPGISPSAQTPPNTSKSRFS